MTDVPEPHRDHFVLLQSKSLADLVQGAILQRIRDGRLGAGDRVNEVMLAEELSISRGPVREALRGLMGDGLVQMRKNLGFFVREIDLREAHEIYKVRGALDRLTGETLAAIITDAQIAELRSLSERMESTVSGSDFPAYYPLNLEFHRLLLVFAGNRRCEQLSDKLIDQLHLFRRRGLWNATSMQASLAEHRAIVAALAARDVDAAGRAMQGHVLAGWERAYASAKDAAQASGKRRRKREAA